MARTRMQQLSSRTTVAVAARAKDMTAAGTTPCSKRREVPVTAEPSVASELSSHGTATTRPLCCQS